MSSVVEVCLSERSYPIWIGSHALDEQLEMAIARLSPCTHCFIVADEQVASLRQSVASMFAKHSIRCSEYIVPSGETSKSIEQLAAIWNEMLESKADRKSVVVAIGGGVVGDLAGFAASTYMRGLRFLQIPTTLLAMVDSSVGGKTGINLPKAKNMVGAFWQPHGVCIDTETLKSLPQREYVSGLAEIVKYGVILDAKLFAYMESNVEAILHRDPKSVSHLVQRSCELKASVVSQDERETTGLRAILNYGHTFGHAIEATTTYGTYLHGEAIAVGMSMAGHLAAKKGFWSQADMDRQTNLIHRLGLPTHLTASPSIDSIANAMQHDKKNEHGVLHLLLPSRLGHVSSHKNIAREWVIEAIAQFCS